jgi:hypothetical protein
VIARGKDERWNSRGTRNFGPHQRRTRWQIELLQEDFIVDTIARSADYMQTLPSNATGTGEGRPGLTVVEDELEVDTTTIGGLDYVKLDGLLKRIRKVDNDIAARHFHGLPQPSGERRRLDEADVPPTKHQVAFNGLASARSSRVMRKKASRARRRSSSLLRHTAAPSTQPAQGQDLTLKRDGLAAPGFQRSAVSQIPSARSRRRRSVALQDRGRARVAHPGSSGQY